MPINHGRRLLLASAARTATTTSPVLRNRRHRGLQLVLNVTVASGTGGLTLHIQQVDRDTGNAIDLAVDSTTVTATGTYGFQMAPGAGSATPLYLPTDWQVEVVHGDASSYTYSLSATLLE
jgi:hypothetical protein